MRENADQKNYEYGHFSHEVPLFPLRQAITWPSSKFLIFYLRNQIFPKNHFYQYSLKGFTTLKTIRVLGTCVTPEGAATKGCC